MFRLLTPVPGRDIDPSTPDSRALSVSWKGPSLNDLVYDLIPFSVMLTPAIVWCIVFSFKATRAY
jgi:hypothetical protein